MDSDAPTKNISLSIPDAEKSMDGNIVPIRNAVSCVKRPKEPVRLGTLSFKPIRLTDLTREILEAENEPLKEVATSEMCFEDDCDGGLKTVLEGKVSENLKSMFENSLDLGVKCLETPAKSKTRPNDDINTLYKETPKVETKKQVYESFVTPSSIKPVNEELRRERPKLRFNLEDNGFLKTPVNPIMINKMRSCRSLTRLTTPHEALSLKNISSDNVFSEKLITVKKANLKTHIDNAGNKENSSKTENNSKSSNKVQFSMPATHLHHNLKEITVKNVTYIVLNQLGRGGSSVVYHCFDLKSKSERAIKKVNLSNESQAIGYVNEVKVLERLQTCDRIVKMYDYEIVNSEKALYVILEKGGLDLAKILKELSITNKHLPMYMLIFYWMEMLYAVKQIHENGIIHSDLKPENFLNTEGGLKLIDFGIASCMPDDVTSVVRNVPIGSCNYISPEALTNDSSNNCNSPSFGKPKFKVNYKSDVWSLGCILYQLVYRKTPFHHIGHMWAKLSAIMDPSHKIDYPAVARVPPRIISTIKRCLQFNVKARPSVDELIQEYENIYG